MSVPSRAYFESSELSLQKALKTRVDAYFEQTGRSRYGDARMVSKSLLYLGALALSWALVTFDLIPGWAAIPTCLFIGFLLAGIGFNVGHDAIHGAFSPRPWLNQLFAHSFDLIGASSYCWSRAHNFVHHTYTNITGVDHDLEPGPWMRFYPRKDPAYLHRFQHLYSFAMYSLTALVWVLKKDFVQVLSPDPGTGKRAPLTEFFKVVGWKAFHLGIFVGAPMVFSHWAWWQVLIGYWMAMSVAGVKLAVVFQLAHVVEETVFIPSTTTDKVPWVEHQFRTTANFAIDNPVARFLCGGLTHQIEHHLFSRICHVHYPALSKIVREVAREHGIPYHLNETFFGALGSHMRQMQRSGREPALQQLVVSAE